MINQEEDGECLTCGTRLDIDVYIGRRIIEDSSLAPMHRTPYNIRTVGIRSTGRIDAQLAAKGGGIGWGAPGKACAVASTGRDRYLRENTRFEWRSGANHETGCSPERIMMRGVRWIAGEDEFIPTVRNFSRRTTTERVKITDLARYHVWWIAWL